MAQNELGKAEAELGIALQLAKEIGNPPQLWRTLMTLGHLRHGQGRFAEAQAACREAVETVQAVADRLDDPTLRETFLASAEISGVMSAI